MFSNGKFKNVVAENDIKTVIHTRLFQETYSLLPKICECFFDERPYIN